MQRSIYNYVVDHIFLSIFLLVFLRWILSCDYAIFAFFYCTFLSISHGLFCNSFYQSEFYVSFSSILFFLLIAVISTFVLISLNFQYQKHSIYFIF